MAKYPPKKVISNSRLPSLKELKKNVFKSISKVVGISLIQKVSEIKRVDVIIDKIFSQLLMLTEKQVLQSKERRPKGAFKRVGEMWMFSYSPTTPQKYWDSFPCVVILEMKKDGFLGINLHYLPEPLREPLWIQLYNLRTQDILTDSTRLKLRYELIQKTLRFRYAKPCIKYYKYNNIDSYLIKIPAAEWATAMYLPTWNFMGGTRRQVWMDSRKQIMKQNRNIGDIK